ncbi:pirin family protein [Sinomonas sp. JGH33]|uniref:Pirin family protein n=1 Tax=Sinomonas terricola TaxID=3110330 RepID=A0ABU5T7A7_9MICC|nr:pirin family protein [Sinomonas sp. JGH33]MEA5455581.1 pirin family protein [Sinomonas sp. JGH33]
MSNLELDPQETLCGAEHAAAAPAVELIEPRDVPLGGPRAMPVRRTLPSKERSLIGAWCFLDHYGPDDVSRTGGMRVPPHPHTGLQTVSWLFTGEVEHRDSAGHHAIVRPGELNLMTAGRGINHSEYSTPGTTVLHGAQLWTALPEGSRHVDPGFERYVPPAVVLLGRDGETAGEARVFLGDLAGSASPVRTHTPLLGAEILLEPGAAVVLALDERFEHGVLADNAPAVVDGADVPERFLAYVSPGRSALLLANPGGERLRLLLLGGTPFDEEITMWWNFVGRGHEEIVGFRAAWQRQIGAEPGATADDGEPFGPVVEATGGDSALPAPELPHVRLRPRGGSRERNAR